MTKGDLNKETLLIKEIREQLNQFYFETSQILLDSRSYDKMVNTASVYSYLIYLNASLKSSYLKIVHVNSFIDCDSLLVDKMYPICYLSNQARDRVYILYCKSDWLMNGLRNLLPNIVDSFEIEPHEKL